MKPNIVDYEYFKHHMDLSSMFLRFWRMVNSEDLMQDEPVLSNGVWIGTRKLENRITGLVKDGSRIKMAYINEDPAGFLFYKPAFNAVLVGIDAFWSEPPYRKTGLARLFLNSLQNQYNGGVFEIYAQIHKDNPPKMMMESFHGCKEVRYCNDRDIWLIQGTWDVSKQGAEDK